MGKHFTGPAEYTDYNERAVEIEKFAGFTSPQVTVLGQNYSLIDTPWLAAGQLIPIRLRISTIIFYWFLTNEVKGDFYRYLMGILIYPIISNW